jgi:hypothetical protein
VNRDEEHSLRLTLKELISLYIVLSSQEDQLDPTQQSVLRRISDRLYRSLSVEQLEELQSYYTSL